MTSRAGVHQHRAGATARAGVRRASRAAPASASTSARGLAPPWRGSAATGFIEHFRLPAARHRRGKRRAHPFHRARLPPRRPRCVAGRDSAHAGSASLRVLGTRGMLAAALALSLPRLAPPRVPGASLVGRCARGASRSGALAPAEDRERGSAALARPRRQERRRMVESQAHPSRRGGVVVPPESSRFANGAAFQRSFDLAERVIPEEIRARRVSTASAFDTLLLRALAGHGWASTGTLAATWRLRNCREPDSRVAAALAGHGTNPSVRAPHRRTEHSRLDSGRRTWKRCPNSSACDRDEIEGCCSPPSTPCSGTAPGSRPCSASNSASRSTSRRASAATATTASRCSQADRLIGRVDLKAQRAAEKLGVLSTHFESPGPTPRERHAVPPRARTLRRLGRASLGRRAPVRVNPAPARIEGPPFPRPVRHHTPARAGCRAWRRCDAVLLEHARGPGRGIRRRASDRPES